MDTTLTMLYIVIGTLRRETSIILYKTQVRLVHFIGYSVFETYTIPSLNVQWSGALHPIIVDNARVATRSDLRYAPTAQMWDQTRGDYPNMSTEASQLPFKCTPCYLRSKSGKFRWAGDFIASCKAKEITEENSQRHFGGS